MTAGGGILVSGSWTLLWFISLKGRYFYSILVCWVNLDEECLLYHFSSIFIWFVCPTWQWNLSISGLIMKYPGSIDYVLFRTFVFTLKRITWAPYLYLTKHTDVLVICIFIKLVWITCESPLFNTVTSWVNVNISLNICFSFSLKWG